MPSGLPQLSANALSLIKPELTAELARQLLAYDPATGLLTWKVDRSRSTKAQDRAGCITDRGYVQIQINGRVYKAHRLAWLIVTGEWPVDQIDHLNGQRSDNSWSNLRDTTHNVNMQNKRSATSFSRTGVLGVIVDRGRFLAAIKVNGKRRFLGRHDTVEQASAAYVAAKRELHAGCTL